MKMIYGVDYNWDIEVHSKPMMKLTGLFWEYSIKDKEIKKKLTIDTYLVQKETDMKKFIPEAFEMINSSLSKFLKESNIHRFIAFKCASVEVDDKFDVSICYYHDWDQYEYIYNTLDGFVMQPVGPLNEQMIQNCKKYYNLEYEEIFPPCD